MEKTDVNAQVTKQARALRKALLRDHKLDVPHSALRAALLQTQGLAPHAQRQDGRAATTQDVPLPVAKPFTAEAWKAWVANWMGERDQVLRAEAYRELLLAPFVQDDAQGGSAKQEMVSRRLHLVQDDDGCLEELALDAAGELRLSKHALHGLNASLRCLQARVPSIRKYGLPLYVQRADTFFSSNFELHVPEKFELQVNDLGDDSADAVVLEVAIPLKSWNALLFDVFRDGTPAGDSLREWLGLHYRRSFDACSPGDKLDWLERYLAAWNGEEA